MIKLVKTDEINKNANAVIDKGCQELEEEIKRLEPEGKPINLAILKQAVLNLNSRLRRNGTISAYEINTARDQINGQNLTLDDQQIRNKQLEARKSEAANENNDIKVGDTVKIKNKNDKHEANDTFLITAQHDDNVEM